MSVSSRNSNDQGLDIDRSPAEDVQKVETDEATYAVYKLGEDVKGYSDFAEGEFLVPGDGKKLLNLETNKERYSLTPKYRGEALEVYEPVERNYKLVIQRIKGSELDEVPEEDRREIRKTMELLD